MGRRQNKLRNAAGPMGKGLPWPPGRPQRHILKSLALKPQVLENCLVLDSRTALSFELLKFCGAPEKIFGRRFFLEIA